MTIPAAFLEELRARTDLPGLIGRAVKLTRAGREWKGCCPFHGEKTASFYVYADHYHCFGCGVHGDGVRWLTDKAGLSFPDAVRELAALAGLEVPQPSPAARARAERAASLRDVVEAGARFFAAALADADGAEARAYLKRRGVSEETAQAFGLGWAPDARTRLLRALAPMGEAQLLEAGLIVRPEEGAPYDRFRGRLIFPIRDPRGRVIGFGGRALGDSQPKYLNSPDTPLFDKGRTLWNLDRAAGPARAAGRLFVVEGYMDAIALAQAGIGEAVAPMGTALTEAQLALAWRLVPEPTLTFDGDSAGRRAAAKAALRALPGLAPGRSLRFAAMPPGEDPDDVVRRGGRAAFESLADAAEPLHEMLWRDALAGADTTTPEGRAGLRQALDDRVALIADKQVREQYEILMRSRFWEAFGWGRRPSIAPAPSSGGLFVPSPFDWAHSALLGLIAHPEVAADHLDACGRLQLASHRLTRLRDALIDLIAWNPDLGREELALGLARAGMADEAAWAHDSYRLRYSFNFGGAPERARAQLAELIERLPARAAALAARARAAGDLGAALAEPGEQQELQLRRSALFDRYVAASRTPGEHEQGLYEFGQHAGLDPDLRARSAVGSVGEMAATPGEWTVTEKDAAEKKVASTGRTVR